MDVQLEDEGHDSLGSMLGVVDEFNAVVLRPQSLLVVEKNEFEVCTNIRDDLRPKSLSVDLSGEVVVSWRLYSC